MSESIRESFLPCIYCNEQDPTFESKYHIFPYSLGNNEMNPRFRLLDEYILPSGIVCDRCSQYFSHTLDSALVEHRVVAFWKALYGREGYSGKKPRYADENISIYYKGNRLIAEHLDGQSILPEPDGSLRLPIPGHDRIDHSNVSRAIHRIGFEYLIFDALKKEKKQAVRNIFSSARYAPIRRYIRSPWHGKYEVRVRLRASEAKPGGAIETSVCRTSCSCAT